MRYGSAFRLDYTRLVVYRRNNSRARLQTMHRGASWWRSNVFPVSRDTVSVNALAYRETKLADFRQASIRSKRTLTIFVTGNSFAGNLASTIKTYVYTSPNLCSANLKETRLEESVYIVTRNSKHDIEEHSSCYVSRISIERYSKRFQTIAHFASPTHSTYFSASLPALPNSKTVAPLRVEIQGAGIQDAKLALQRPPRGSGRVRDSSATQVSPAALYSVPRVQLCLWLWCCSPRDDRSTTTNRWNLPSCAHTRATDGCIIRKGMVRSWMMARIEGWR